MEERIYTGIISAMQKEIDLLLGEAKIERVDSIGGVDYHVGSLCGCDVVIAKAGIGKVMASSGMTAMICNFKLSRVIFTGIAGGVGDDTKVLDQVIGTSLVQHDFGQYTREGFSWIPGFEGESGYYDCDPGLVQLAYDSAVKVIGPEHVFKGMIASGDQFIASESQVERLQKDFDAIACEMEGASVAIVCSKYHIPFVVIRAMSDKADGNAHESYDNMADIAADHSCRTVMEMLKSSAK